MDIRKCHTRWVEQSSSFVQYQPFQLSVLRSEFQLDQLHRNDVEEDARTGMRQQDRGKVKANGDKPGRHCLDKFFDCEQSDCVEKPGDTQSIYRETWRKRPQSRLLKNGKKMHSGREYRETCRTRISRNSRKLGSDGTDEDWPHNLDTSTNYVLHMEKVFSIVRQSYGLSPTDQMKNLDVNTAIWRIFMSDTLQAAAHLGKDCTENLRSSKNQPLTSLRQLLQAIERLITDQTEISGLTTIVWQQPMWRETTLLTDRAVQFATAKTYVFSDSVLCLGGISDEPVKARESRIKWFLETRYLKDLDRIDEEPMEFEWTNFPGFTTLGILDEVQNMMTQSKCEPEQFKGRITFMSMYNDIGRGKTRKERQM